MKELLLHGNPLRSVAANAFKHMPDVDLVVNTPQRKFITLLTVGQFFTFLDFCLRLIVTLLSVAITENSLRESSVATGQMSRISLRNVSRAVIGIEITQATLMFILIWASLVVSSIFVEKSYMDAIRHARIHTGDENKLFYVACSVLWCRSALTLVLFIPSEVIAYTFMSCFNYTSNQTVVARALMIFLLAVLWAVNVVSIECEVSVTKYRRRRRRRRCSAFNLTRYVLWPLAFLPFLCIFLLNVVLLAKLRAPLDFKIEPDNIHMGFFNRAEIAAIQNGSFDAAMMLDVRLVGRLIYLRKGDPALDEMYSFNINCSLKQNQLFFEDCAANNSLTVYASYFKWDSSEYPYYTCVIKTGNRQRNVPCSRLLANYELILVQKHNGKIEPAWTGLSNCGQPSFRLILKENF